MSDDARSVAALLMALVFGVSAASKVRHPVRFAKGVASYDLLPEWASYPAAALIVAVETLLALCHLSGQLMPAPAYGALALLCGFTALAVATLRRGQPRACFCFDMSGHERTSARAVARLALLIACETVVLWGPSDRLYTLSDLWRAGHLTASTHVVIMAVAVVVGGRWILRLGDISRACCARQRASWVVRTAESRFRDWGTVA